jgi:hypothetical protein
VIYFHTKNHDFGIIWGALVWDEKCWYIIDHLVYLWSFGIYFSLSKGTKSFQSKHLPGRQKITQLGHPDGKDFMTFFKILDEDSVFDLSTPLNRKLSLVPDDEFIPVSPAHHGHQSGLAYKLEQVIKKRSPRRVLEST